MPFQSLFEEFIFKRTYARFLDDLGRRETWPETVSRYKAFFLPRVPASKVTDFSNVCEAIERLDVLPSMRSLWTAGPALERENVCGYNCAYMAVDRVASFSEALFLLLCGTGVGFSVERQYINKLPDIPPRLDQTAKVIEVADSKEGWAKAFRDLCNALYDGGVPTWDVSKVRPAGARLKTFGGRASGPGPLEDLFRFTISLFKEAKGRKLNSVECHRIMCKAAESVVVGGVRRSACISFSNPSDDRMRNLKSGAFWETMPELTMANNSAAYTEKPDAQRFFEDWLALVRSKSGERGIFNRESARYIVGLNGRRGQDYEWGANPCCFTGEMMLKTANGDLPFATLAGRDVDLITPEGILARGSVWEAGDRPVVELVFEKNSGRRPIRCTPDQVFRLADGSERQAKDLKGCRLMPFVRMTSCYVTEEIFAGFILGDANLNRLRSKDHAGLEVYFGERDGDVAALFGKPVGTWYSQEAMEVAAKYSLGAWKTYERRLPDPSLRTPSFLAGLYSANGTVLVGQGRCRVAYKTTSLQLAEELVETLMGYGIKAYITTNKKHSVRHHNGEYESRESYDVNIIAISSLMMFAERIAFVQGYKREKLLRGILEVAPYVKTVRPSGMEMTYDFNEPSTNWGIVEGVVAHNCEVILRNRQFCNLSEVVIRPEDDLETLKRKVRWATILGTLQSTLTKFNFIGREWKKNCEEERLCGVSLTGLRDHEVLSRVSNEAKLWLTAMKQVAIDTSEEYAKALSINMPAAITLIKPSGTVSSLVNCSAGLHPRYAPYYVRRVRVAAADPIALFLRDRGVPWYPEVGQSAEDPKTYVFEFPVKAPKRAVFRDEVTAIEQLEYWLMLQRHWCEGKPSATIYVRDEEWPRVGAWIYDHWNWVSGIAFLPYDGGAYKLMPYEEISQVEYHTLQKKIPALDFSKLVDYEESDFTMGAREFACTGGSCDIL